MMKNLSVSPNILISAVAPVPRLEAEKWLKIEIFREISGS